MITGEAQWLNTTFGVSSSSTDQETNIDTPSNYLFRSKVGSLLNNTRETITVTVDKNYSNHRISNPLEI